MGKLSFKLHKTENNTAVSLYQIHFKKLHENIFKYDKSNFSKKLPFASTMANR